MERYLLNLSDFNRWEEAESWLRRYIKWVIEWIKNKKSHFPKKKRRDDAVMILGAILHKSKVSLKGIDRSMGIKYYLELVLVRPIPAAE